MPTVVAVKKQGTLCIGADLLTIDKDRKYTEKDVLNLERIVKPGKDVYIGAVDHPAWPFILRSYFKHSKRTHHFHNPDEIFEELLHLHPVLKEKYFTYPDPDEGDPFECSQFESLIISRSGLFKTSWLRAVQEYTRFCAVGSGSAYALGAMEAIYEKGKSAEEIARIGLTVASEYDVGTGLPGELFTVSLK